LLKTSPTPHDSLSSSNPSHLKLLRTFCLFSSYPQVTSFFRHVMPQYPLYSSTTLSSVIEPQQFLSTFSKKKYSYKLFLYCFINFLDKYKSLIVDVRTRFDPQPKRYGQWPNEPKTINLLESGPAIERSMS